MQVILKHERQELIVFALEGMRLALDAGTLTRQPTVAAIDDPTVPVAPDRLAQSVGGNGYGEVSQALFLHQREKVGDLVELGDLDLGHAGSHERVADGAAKMYAVCL
jgi:hypothetical protein